ncbi:glycosidase, partial [bacterium]|nr:glycosidase [bacterium]
ELEGDVPNVVFPEGTAVFDDQLIVYYGGGDKVIAMAECSLSEIVTALVEQI